MARIPQNKPAEGAAMMRDFAQNPYVKGTRLTFHRPVDRNWMIDGTNDWYWPLAEELGIRTMVHAPIWKTELGAIADRHPGLRIIIDHMGIMARCVDDAIGYWVSETAALAGHPNIYVKVSAIPGYSTEPFPNLNIAPYVREMVDRMGPQRCFWGTDLTRLMGHGLTYTDTIEQFTKHFPFTGEELEWIMGRGICECLDWPVRRPPETRPEMTDAHPDGGEALLQACRDLGADYIFSSAGSEWAPVWEALARQAETGAAGPRVPGPDARDDRGGHGHRVHRGDRPGPGRAPARRRGAAAGGQCCAWRAAHRRARRGVLR